MVTQSCHKESDVATLEQRCCAARSATWLVLQQDSRPPVSLSRVQRRGAITARLTIDLIRANIVAYKEGTDFDASASEVLLGAALFVGQAEGKPMTAAKAAAYIGMPRATAVRKLQEMKVGGVAEVSPDGRHWRLTFDATSERAKRTAELIEEKASAIQKAAAKLSKMDTPPVAGKPASS
jgi:hypothetical protein